MFCCTFDKNKGARGKLPEDTWRCQAAVRLNGMFMYDADELMESHGILPEQLYAKIPQWLYDEKETRHIVYVGSTPSGDGLRIVATCDPEKGNLADHQQWLGTLLGVPCDKSVKDASRGSFVVSKDYIYYLNEGIFEYHNEAYREKFDACYRKDEGIRYEGGGTKDDVLPSARKKVEGGSTRDEVGGTKDFNPQPSNIHLGNADTSSLNPQPSNLEETYHDVSYQKIVDVYCARNPDYARGDRHPHLLKMAGRLRYIVDNNPEKLKQLVRLAQYVQDWEAQEHNGKEIDDACTTACQQKFYMSKPKVVQDVLQRAGVKSDEKLEEQERQAQAEQAHVTFAKRLSDLPEPYKTVMQGINPLNVIPAIYASGTMMCTLLTRCHYMHYTGDDQRMNPQAEIIGMPASGKSFADHLNRILMSPMKTADEMARKSEKSYKDERTERETSSKAQKGDAVKRPELPILYLPTNTSNNIFFRRLYNAKEELPNGEEYPLHLYMFDAELASANKGGGGGDWKEKRDLELKAFHNEETGVDYANNDSINDLMNVYWNTVTTGTKVALAKKFTLQNINDGLCLRVAIAPMVDDSFKMIAKGKALEMAERRAKLLSWAYEMWGVSGEMPIAELVDHSYDLCADAAKLAEERNDKVLDVIRRRAALFAVWFTVPIIAVRAIEERRKLAAANKEGEELPKVIDLMKVTKSDLDFCTVMFDSVVYWQDAFFGQMLQDSWENGNKAFVPRVRASRNSDAYAMLPQQFKNADVQAKLNLNSDQASSQIARWEKKGYVTFVGNRVYKKNVDYII